MAQRPFATTYVQFSKTTSGSHTNSLRRNFQQENLSNNSSVSRHHRTKKSGNSSGALLQVRYNSANEEISGISAPLLIQNRDSNFSIQPLAIEPCANEKASVATVLIQMPQNQTLNFGSVLTPISTLNSSHPQIHTVHSS